MVTEGHIRLAKARDTHGWRKRIAVAYMEIVDVDIKTSTDTIIDWVNKCLIRFAQDTGLRVYIAQAIFCFLAGDTSAILVPFRTSFDALRQCW